MRELDAMNQALEKYPNIKPHYEKHYQQLRALCFPDVAGLDVRQDFEEITYQTGVPWTFQLMHKLKGIMSDDIIVYVPLYIMEVHRLMNANADYSNTFANDPDTIFIEKQIKEHSKDYYFVVRNKALMISLKDYGDHLYIDIEGFHDDLELGSSEEWSEEKSKRFTATYNAWNSVDSRGGGHWSGSSASKGVCRGNIKKDIEKAKAIIAAVTPFVFNDLSLRSKAYIAKEFSNVMPELS